MFNFLKSLAPAKGELDKTITKDAIAEMLRTSPEKLAEFEASYKKHALGVEPEDDLLHMNSRQMSEKMHRIDPDAIEKTNEDVTDLIDRIVDELLADTVIYEYDGNTQHLKTKCLALPAGTEPVTAKTIKALPETLRPQLTGELMHVDLGGEPGYHALLYMLDRSKHAKTEKQRQEAYVQFRAGLDILDLDPVIYEMLSMNRNSMGNWLPQLVTACERQNFFRIPKTRIAKVPMTLLQLTRLDYQSLTKTTLDIVDAWARKAFKLEEDKSYFIKTGTYSSKFDFRNAKVTGPKEVRELGEYLLFIHFQANQMASYLVQPRYFGVSTTNEWVVREFIEDKENNPCIYKGLPLHTEYRIFVDCDAKTVLGITPYWEPETMKQRFGHEDDADSPHQIHDYIVYKSHEDVLMGRYEANKQAVLEHVREILPDLDLHGQWSIDIMQNGDEFWVIDMALAENSAFYKDCVPEKLRAPQEEDWIPAIGQPD